MIAFQEVFVENMLENEVSGQKIVIFISILLVFIEITRLKALIL